eukprot:g56063.t1
MSINKKSTNESVLPTAPLLSSLPPQSTMLQREGEANGAACPACTFANVPVQSTRPRRPLYRGRINPPTCQARALRDIRGENFEGEEYAKMKIWQAVLLGGAGILIAPVLTAFCAVCGLVKGLKVEVGNAHPAPAGRGQRPT